MQLYPKLILDALAKVRYPGNGKDLVANEMIEDDIRIDGNKVSFSIIFDKPTDPYPIGRESRRNCHSHFRKSRSKYQRKYSCKGETNSSSEPRESLARCKEYHCRFIGKRRRW